MKWWWQKPDPEPKMISKDVTLPSGTFVRSAALKNVYYIKGGTKFKCHSERVFQSWNAPCAYAAEVYLTKYKTGGTLGFRDGTLIHNIADGRMYLVSANKRRHITSPDVFDAYGLDRSRVIEVSDAETRLHEEGEPLN
jgi:hypothetical protein